MYNHFYNFFEYLPYSIMEMCCYRSDMFLLIRLTQFEMSIKRESTISVDKDKLACRVEITLYKCFWRVAHEHLPISSHLTLPSLSLLAISFSM